MVTQLEVAWLAGILEGEGCFRVNDKGHSLVGQIFMTSTDQDVVLRVYFATDFRGNVTGPHTPSNHNPLGRKEFWKWTCTKRSDVVAICNSVLPFMGMRRTESIKKMLEDLPMTHYNKPIENYQDLRIEVEV